MKYDKQNPFSAVLAMLKTGHKYVVPTMNGWTVTNTRPAPGQQYFRNDFPGFTRISFKFTPGNHKTEHKVHGEDFEKWQMLNGKV